MFLNKNICFAVAAIVGMTVGAGIFGLPYVVSKSGLIAGFFYLVLLGGATLLLNLLLGEIVLRTSEKHRLAGYARKYLGRKGGILITTSTLFGLGTLLAYIILGGSFLEILASPWFSIDSFYLSLAFGIFLGSLMFLGIKFIAPLELFSNSLFLLIIFTVFLFTLPHISLERFELTDISNLFLPYGAILFAFSGLAAIPEISDILKTRQERSKYRTTIISSSIIIFSIYILFAMAVVGVSGSDTSVDALGGLAKYLGPEIILIGAMAGVITLADSFLIMGLYLKNTLVYDYKFPKFLSAFFVAATPIVLFWAGLRGFIETIGLVGAIAGAIEGIAVIFIFQKVKSLGDREPEYSLNIPRLLLYFLIAVFALGGFLQILLNLQ